MKVSLITHGTVINLLTVVVDGGQDGDGLLRDIDTREDSGGLRDTRETLVQDFGGEMAELKVAVVLLRANTTTLTDLDRHATRHDITRGKILRSRGVTLHEALTLSVEKVASLTARTCDRNEWLSRVITCIGNVPSVIRQPAP